MKTLLSDFVALWIPKKGEEEHNWPLIAVVLGFYTVMAVVLCVVRGTSLFSYLSFMKPPRAICMVGKRSLILIFCGYMVSVYAKPLSQKTQALVQEVNSLIYSNKHDSAQVFVLQYLESTGLTDLETFYGHFLFADVLKSSGKPGEAIGRLRDIGEFLGNVPHKTRYKSLVEGKIAECHFDLMSYEDAKMHALASIRTNPDSSLRAGGHAVNYLIVGYSDYLDKNFGSALDHYNRASKEYQDHGEACEIPLVYTKIAKVYNTMGNEKLTEEYINKAIFISDSCDIETYKLLTKYALFDIYKDNEDYQSALEVMMEINDLNGTIEQKKQDRLINTLQVQYETKLMQRKNENLQQINQKNEELLAKQKQALIISVIAMVLLSILAIYLYRGYRQKKRVNRELADRDELKSLKIDEIVKQLREEIAEHKRTKGQLEAINVELNNFMYKSSHDLKGPLASIIGLTNMAKGESTEEERLEYVEMIAQSTQRLNSILESLLQTTRVTHNTLNITRINFHHAVNEVIKGLSAAPHAQGVKVHIAAAGGLEFYSDEKLFSTVMQNLIENGMKYKNPDTEDPWVRVEAVRQERGVEIKVIDNGQGIPEGQQSQVFEMFVRANLDSEGTGLGLYIVKKSIEKLGGLIEMESEEGVGSTFRLFILDREALVGLTEEVPAYTGN